MVSVEARSNSKYLQLEMVVEISLMVQENVLGIGLGFRVSALPCNGRIAAGRGCRVRRSVPCREVIA